MYEFIRTQQAYAQEKQSALTDYDKDYLFVSPVNKRLITEAEFNSYLHYFGEGGPLRATLNLNIEEYRNKKSTPRISRKVERFW